MNDKQVYFLGSCYVFPDELREYVVYLKEFEKTHQNVMELLIALMKSGTYKINEKDSFDYFKEPLTQIGNGIISKLMSKGIYNVTLEEVVFNNKGYIKLYDVCEQTRKALFDVLSEALDDLVAGLNRAHTEATSTITGPTASIWTSSVTSALLYSGYEASVVAKQRRDADKRFKEIISSTSSRINNDIERKNQNVLATIYYPGVAEALSLFVSELRTFYLKKLEEYNLFNYSRITGYDMKRSSSLLANFDLAENKKELLKAAFKCCPYNPDVYDTALKNGLADENTFETAMYFMQDEFLCPSLEDYISENRNSANSIQIPVKILSRFRNRNEDEIWKELYNADVSKANQCSSMLEELLSSKDSLSEWVQKNICSTSTELISMQSETILHFVEAALKPYSIEQDKFATLKQLNLLAPKVQEFDSMEHLIKENSRKLAETITSSLPNVERHIRELEPEVEKIRQQYESSQSAYDAKVEELHNQQLMLAEAKKNLGIFSFRKRKEIEQKEIACASELSEFKSNDSTKDIQEEYEKLYAQMCRIVL